MAGWGVIPQMSQTVRVSILRAGPVYSHLLNTSGMLGSSVVVVPILCFFRSKGIRDSEATWNSFVAV